MVDPFWYAVIAIIQPKPMPVDGGFQLRIIGEMDRDFRALSYLQGWTRNRAIIGKHFDIGVADLFADDRGTEVEGIAIFQFDDLRLDCFG
jgi:hypothetical protein